MTPKRNILLEDVDLENDKQVQPLHAKSVSCLTDVLKHTKIRGPFQNRRAMLCKGGETGSQGRDDTQKSCKFPCVQIPK